MTLESITVSGPTKTEYEIGDELDLTGLVVTAHYSDGSEVAVEDYEVSGFDSSTAGEKTITVTYQDKTTTFTAVSYTHLCGYQKPAEYRAGIRLHLGKSHCLR